MLRRGVSLPSLGGVVDVGSGGGRRDRGLSPAGSRAGFRGPNGSGVGGGGGLGGLRTPTGSVGPGGGRRRLSGAGHMNMMSRNQIADIPIADLQSRNKGGMLSLSLGGGGGSSLGHASAFLLESRARMNQSQVSAEMDRRQGNKIMQINRALDTEMDQLFETLVRKRGALKVESLPLQRISSDAKHMEPLDGGGPQVPLPSSTNVGRPSAEASCGVCMKNLKPGEIVRPMIHCCNAPQHALCLRNFMHSEACCPNCMDPVLTPSELRSLLETVR